MKGAAAAPDGAKGVRGGSSEIIAENRPARPAYLDDSHAAAEIRRCRRCGVRKVLELGFYRDRKSRGGYRRECKRCRNRQRARWARRRYLPKSGRRYQTGADRNMEARG